ncbi:PIN domain-containing protein [Azohydromonas lata]|uniref:PIN domain-containing protein n=1 Tax=Azohydromonas lata TaxID=45677 RepID=UPI000A052DFD|nr:PIN domain-containing protein [Azohydromonas lata]
MSDTNSSCAAGAPSPSAAPGPYPSVVLDSNAVLDWLLFGDASMRPLGEAIAAGHCRWIVSGALRGELEHVLARGLRSRPQVDTQPLWLTWDALARPVEQPADTPSPPGLRCTDSDDQKFLALALAHGARWLVSRDRAVLKLRKRARERGLLIVTPTQWMPDDAPVV